MTRPKQRGISLLLEESIPERAFQKKVCEAAMYLGWLVTHFEPARVPSGQFITPVYGHAGFPDLVLVKAPWFVCSELKAQKAYLAPHQKLWAEAIRGCPGVYYDVWKPRMWPQILEILQHGPPAGDAGGPAAAVS